MFKKKKRINNNSLHTYFGELAFKDFIFFEMSYLTTTVTLKYFGSKQQHKQKKKTTKQ